SKQFKYGAKPIYTNITQVISIFCCSRSLLRYKWEKAGEVTVLTVDANNSDENEKVHQKSLF
ncbi:MAG: hypothetical protein WAT88_05695, partial [Saprospiraceae bacterium]